MIQEGIKDEIFSEGDAYFCSKCDTKVSSATKSLTLQKLPSALLITLNRFYFDKKTLQKEKVLTPVNIPSTLSMDGQNFNLYSIVIHAGRSANFGHYYTVSKEANTEGPWRIFNDASVTELSGTIEMFLSNLHQKFLNDPPYILAYAKVNSSALEFKLPENLRHYVI